MQIRNLPTLAVLLTGLTSLGSFAQASDWNYQGAIFTMNNAVDGNEVIVLGHSQGHLTPLGSFPTGGVGTGAGLGNQGALELSDDLRWLLVVNAGDNTLSSLAVTPRGLKIKEVIDSDGERPVSVTVHHNLVYVVNAGSDSIAGFRLTRHGRLIPIKESVQVLSSNGTGPRRSSSILPAIHWWSQKKQPIVLSHSPSTMTVWPVLASLMRQQARLLSALILIGAAI
jgi:6-phosphogluconolactonase